MNLKIMVQDGGLFAILNLALKSCLKRFAYI